MTAADKLRDLRDEISRLSRLALITREEIARGAELMDAIVDAIPEIAAVIEAAQVAADYAHHGDLLEWETHCDSVDPGCPGCALLDSLAALNARLDGAA